MCRCASTRTEKEEMLQYSRKDDEQRDAAALTKVQKRQSSQIFCYPHGIPCRNCPPREGDIVGTSYVKTNTPWMLFTYSRTHEQVDLLVTLIKLSSLEIELLRFRLTGDNAQGRKPEENHNLISANLNP
ncbi:hypothetical protein V6N11_080383 [Hibiscus sabdariffa]|uniref:Uncharacterized protein n=1 Tax=Hibiscus sabdariffa TaxID=183260 RepID=A0ABR2R7I6_9ROSI